MTSLRRRAMISLGASYVSQFLQTGTNFATKILLARLVLPEGWGVYAEAMMVVLVADTLTDMGLSQHVIREKQRPYGNVLMIRLILAVLYTAAVIALAPLLAVLFQTQAVIGPVRVLAFLIVVRALVSVPKVYLDRELMVHKALIPQTAAVATMAAVSLPMGYAGYGIWALVAGTLAAELVQMGLMWAAVRRLIPIEMTMQYTRRLLRGARYLFAIAVVGFVIQQGHVAVTGSLLLPEKVGIYAMAFTLVTLVSQLVENAIYRVIYPLFCELSSDIDRIGRIYNCATVMIISIEAPIAFFLLFNSHFLIQLLLGDSWLPMAPILAALAPAQIISKHSTFGLEVLRATKKDRWLMLVSTIAAGTVAIGGYILTKEYGLMGMVGSNYIVLGGILMFVVLLKIIPRQLMDVIRKTILVYVITFAIAAVPTLLDNGHSARHLLAVGGMFMSWVILGRLFWKPVIKPMLKEL
jgi:teichuronic acid exporter